jgi:hypothetical protein
MAQTTVSIEDLARRLAATERELAASRRGRPRRRLSPARRQRRVATLIVGLLVALVPLSLLAAPVFSDLGTAAPEHRGNIQAIGDAGVTTGFADPNNPGQRLYNPKDNVTREEMASFLARLGGLGNNPPVVNALTAQSVAAGAITPANLSGAGSTTGQVLTSTGSGVAFQDLPTIQGPIGPPGPAGPSGATNATVRQATIALDPNASPPVTAATVSCLANERATGGGYTQTTAGPFAIGEDRPLFDPTTNIPTGWRVAQSAGFPFAATVTVYAICVPTP